MPRKLTGLEASQLPDPHPGRVNWPEDAEVCMECHGTARQTVLEKGENSNLERVVVCPDCDGRGYTRTSDPPKAKAAPPDATADGLQNADGERSPDLSEHPPAVSLPPVDTEPVTMEGGELSNGLVELQGQPDGERVGEQDPPRTTAAAGTGN